MENGIILYYLICNITCSCYFCAIPKLWEIYNTDEKFLGVTATPTRLSGEPFKDFDVLVKSHPIKWFIHNGYLSKYKYYVTSIPDVSNVQLRGGDYAEEEISRIMTDHGIMADLVESYKKYALNKKSIIFAVDIKHSHSIVERFSKEGFRIAHIDGKTPKNEREYVIGQFRNGDIQILSNVGIINEGFDLPDCEVVQLARPTKSLTLYLQQVGRCLRPYENKEFALILDNAGCWVEHGLPSLSRTWSLEGVESESISQTVCAIDKHGGIKETTKPKECKDLSLKLLEEIEEMDADELIKTIERLEKNYEEKLRGLDSVPPEYHDIVKRGLTDLKNELDAKKSQLKLIHQQEADKRINQARIKLEDLLNEFLDDYEFFDEDEKNNFIKKIHLTHQDMTLKVSFQEPSQAKTIHKIPGHKKKIKRIEGFYFKNQFYPESKGVTLLVNTLNILIKENPKLAEQVFGEIHRELLSYERRSFGTSIENLFGSNDTQSCITGVAKQLENGWWVDTHSNTKQKIDLLKKVLTKMNYQYGIDYKVKIADLSG